MQQFFSASADTNSQNLDIETTHGFHSSNQFMQ